MPKPEPAIAQALLAWFEANKREMPWRTAKQPYHTWISEIMLQQTQVATVIPYFERFLASFPTPQALASAPEDQVLKAWEGLGYYSRARNLQAAARRIVAEHGGEVPDTWEAVRALPGVGDYTAGAILSIAYGQSVPAVDGNVMRVIARLFRLEDDVTKPATKRAIEEIVSGLIPGDRPGDFNEALMELGATVCTPNKPLCAQCPLAAFCRARAEGVQEALPIKTKKQAPKAVTLAAALVEREGRVLLVRRPAGGIWAGLWAYPSVEPAPGESPEAALGGLLAQLGLQVQLGALMQTVSHTLTHRQLTIPVYRATAQGGNPGGESVWAAPCELALYALPVPFQKLAAAQELGPLFSSVEA